MSGQFAANVIVNRDGKFSSAVGPEATEAWRLRALIIAVNFEGKTRMKMTRGPSALSLAKKTTGLKTSDRAKQVARLQVMLDARLSKCIIEDATDPEKSE